MSSLRARRAKLQQEIDGGEKQLRAAVEQLRSSLQAKVDVGQQVSRRPYELLGTAIGIGFLVGAIQALRSNATDWLTTEP